MTSLFPHVNATCDIEICAWDENYTVKNVHSWDKKLDGEGSPAGAQQHNITQHNNEDKSLNQNLNQLQDLEFKISSRGDERRYVASAHIKRS